MSDSDWYVYIVACADGTLYTGITTDVDRRVDKHNDGKASRYTRSRLPVTLVYKEAATGRSAASKRERLIKALSREDKLALVNHSTCPQPD